MGDRDNKIAMFIPSLFGGGGERITINLAGELRRRGYPVDLVVGTSEGPLRDELPSGVRLVDLGAARVRHALVPLVRYLREERPAVLMPTIEHANVLGIAATAMARTSTKVVVRVANTLSEVQAGPPTPVQRLVNVLVRLGYRRADALVACSTGMADDLAPYVGVPRDQVRVIYNAAVPPNLDELIRAGLDHPWFAAGEPPVIIAVGRLSVQKNFPLLLDAFARLRRRRAARLVVLGEGPLLADLEDQADALGVASDVGFWGFDANPYRFVARSEVFCLSSDWEGLPGVLIEALACGTKVVATDCPSGPREILHSGEFGRLVPRQDPGLLAEALSQAIDDTSEVDPRSWAPFTADAAGTAYVQLIEELCAPLPTMDHEGSVADHG